MSLVVGHNCPDCGLDTPAVTCETCHGDVVWNRESGSHCGACGLSASTFTCPECGLRTELDKHEPERVARAPVRLKRRVEALEREPDEVRSFAWLPHVGSTIARSPALRSAAVVALVSLPALAIVLLIGGPDSSTPRRISTVAAAPPIVAPVPERLARGTVELSLEAKPVPLPPRNPAFDPPPSFADASPPPATRYDTGYRPAPRRDGGGWLQRVLRSGRSYSAANDRLPADGAGIGR